MTTVYYIQDYTKGVNGFGTTPCDTNYSVVLGASSATALTVPGGGGMGISGAYSNNKFLMVLNYAFSTTVGAPVVYVSVNGTAAAPSGSGSWATSSSMQNPLGLQVKAGDVISFYTTATAVNVTASFFSNFGS